VRRITHSTVLAAGLFYWLSSVWVVSPEAVLYPEGYRRWTHVKSAIIGPGNPAYARFGGLHHIYANDKAMEGYRNGQFPDGSVIVADFLETQTTKEDVTSAGPRRLIDVMHKDHKRFPETGGWGFEEFRGDSRTERTVGQQRAKTDCYNCHAGRKEQDFVFSSFRE